MVYQDYCFPPKSPQKPRPMDFILERHKGDECSTSSWWNRVVKAIAVSYSFMKRRGLVHINYATLNLV
jgi:hypothetical protein